MMTPVPTCTQRLKFSGYCTDSAAYKAPSETNATIAISTSKTVFILDLHPRGSLGHVHCQRKANLDEEVKFLDSLAEWKDQNALLAMALSRLE
jgi:hypothetical protein